MQGTEPYQTRVWIDADQQLNGACDCPHAADGNFCKHQVALALTLRGIMGGDDPPQDEAAAKKVAAAAKRAETQAKNREALRTFLNEQSASALAERLWQWAERDRHLMADLKAWLAESRAATDPKAVTQAINDLLRNTREYLTWQEADRYAERAGKVLPLLRPWLQHDPAQLLELCDHTLRRLHKVAEQCEETDGGVGALIQQVDELMLQALRASPPPASWLDRWFSQREASLWNRYSEAEVLAAAGPAVQARYMERAAHDWQRWLVQHRAQAEPARPGKPRKKGDTPEPPIYRPYDPERQTLRTRYLGVLQGQGDIQAAIDVMRADLANAREHCELVAFCEAHGRQRDALQYAEAARRQHPDDRQVEEALLRCYERDGWDDEALAIRRRQLERTPDPTHYRWLLDAAERAGHDRAEYRAQLFAWAEAQEQQPKRRDRPLNGLFQGYSHEHRQYRPDVSVRVGWLLADQRVNEALAVVQSSGSLCAVTRLLEVARALPSEQNHDAVPLLLRVFQHAMAGAKSPYREPLALVRETLQRMTPEQGREWLAQLRGQYKPKRHFVAGLP